ncbi:MAG: relaxase, partial [Lachnospiraceae bacterium]|nr:relaxase [Lachnospiraceae bacterium]
LRHFRGEVMEMCHREGLYQIDLLNGSKNRVTNREYHAARRGQEELDRQNVQRAEQGLPVVKTKYETEKETLRRVIRQAMEKTDNLYDFKRFLESEYHVEVKESRGRFSYLTPGRQKPITSRMLGTDFSKESIEMFFASGKQKAAQKVKATVERVIDIEAKKAEGKGAGYEKWAKLFNLKQSAKALAFIQERNIRTLAELDQAISDQVTAEFDARHAIKDIEKEIADCAELADWCVKYRENNPVCKKIKACKTKKEQDDFRDSHSANFILRDAAVRYFKEHNITQLPSAKALAERRADLISQKNESYNKWQEEKQLLQDLRNARTNMQAVLGQEQTITKTKRRSQDMSL